MSVGHIFGQVYEEHWWTFEIKQCIELDYSNLFMLRVQFCAATENFRRFSDAVSFQQVLSKKVYHWIS